MLIKAYKNLQQLINKIFIVGLDACSCIYMTSIGAIDKGYKAIVLKDAIVTSNMSKMPKILEKYGEKGIVLTTISKFKENN